MIMMSAGEVQGFVCALGRSIHKFNRGRHADPSSSGTPPEEYVNESFLVCLVNLFANGTAESSDKATTPSSTSLPWDEASSYATVPSQQSTAYLPQTRTARPACRRNGKTPSNDIQIMCCPPGRFQGVPSSLSSLCTTQGNNARYKH